MVHLADLRDFLDHYLDAGRFPGDPSGIYRPSARPIHTVGLTLEPRPGLAGWIAAARIDALFVHRPWRLAPEGLPAADDAIGVLAYHLPFDERLTTGYNPRLAEVLGLAAPEPFGEKEGRPLGMIGGLARQDVARFGAVVAGVFGGVEAVGAGRRAELTSAVVVGAMTDALVREAASRGAGIYVTGQFREPARLAVVETGIATVAVGHRRGELWGLRALAHLLAERWAGLRVLVHE